MQFNAAQFYDEFDRPAGWGIFAQTAHHDDDWLIDDRDLTKAGAEAAAADLNRLGWQSWNDLDWVIVNRITEPQA